MGWSVNRIANLLTKREGGKSSIKVGDAREFVKKMINFDAECKFRMMREEGYAEVQNCTPLEWMEAEAKLREASNRSRLTTKMKKGVKGADLRITRK